LLFVLKKVKAVYAGASLFVNDLIIGLDIGSTKVCAIIAESTDKSNVNVLGVGIAPSGDGVKRGAIVDIERTTRAIIDALDEADKSVANIVIESAYVGIAGAHINSVNSHGVVAIKGNNQEIASEDIDRAVENAKTAITIPSHQDIIHILPREFVVDEQREIQNPISMVGSRLEAHVHIITGAITAIQNIMKCCGNADLKVEELVLQPYASSLAVLTEDEKRLGVVLVDIGGGTTDVTIFQNGCVVHSGCIDMGGKLITNDLAVGLKTSTAVAESLKIKHGVALPNRADEELMLKMPVAGGDESYEYSQRYLSEIIEPRLAEIFYEVKDILDAHVESPNLIPAGVVLTGGTSLMDCCAEQAREILGLPVRRGTPINVTGIKEKIVNPQYATAIGLIRYGALNIRRSGGDSRRSTRIFEKFRSFIEKFFTN
jgi:cell division protein FtsA